MCSSTFIYITCATQIILCMQRPMHIWHDSCIRVQHLIRIRDMRNTDHLENATTHVYVTRLIQTCANSSFICVTCARQMVSWMPSPVLHMSRDRLMCAITNLQCDMPHTYVRTNAFIYVTRPFGRRHTGVCMFACMYVGIPIYIHLYRASESLLYSAA